MMVCLIVGTDDRVTLPTADIIRVRIFKYKNIIIYSLSITSRRLCFIIFYFNIIKYLYFRFAIIAILISGRLTTQPLVAYTLTFITRLHAPGLSNFSWFYNIINYNILLFLSHFRSYSVRFCTIIYVILYVYKRLFHFSYIIQYDVLFYIIYYKYIM